MEKTIEKYTIKDATHLLECRHAVGSHGRYYSMKCIVLKKTKSGNLKLLVFGDRNWKGHDDKKQIRYISERAFRIFEIKQKEVRNSSQN